MPITDLIPWRRKDPVRAEEKGAVSGEAHPLTVFQRDMNRLFDEFFRGPGLAPFGETSLGAEWPAFSPRVDVVETDKEMVVSAELPGLEDKDIDVSLSRDMLTIKGEKKQEMEEQGRNYYRAERSYGSFQRSIPLPSEVDTAKVNAVFQRGVLTITLPKTGGAQGRRRIEVKTR
jgi:HSP20 family protein